MKISLIGIGFLSVGLLCGRASALETVYEAGARALPGQQGGEAARAMGMGSAVVAVPQGSASLFWNPAGLGLMSSREIGLHHNSGAGGAIQEIMIVGSPLGEVKEDGKGGSLGGIAASFGYMSYGSFPGTDDLGQPIGDYQSGNFSGSLGWGKKLMRGISGGLTLKLNKSTFASKSNATYSMDAGFLWNVKPAVDLGVSYNNLNSDSRMASGWRLGAGWNVKNNWLLAASTELQIDAMNRLQLGTEYLIGNVKDKVNVLALRGGYQLHYPNRQLGALAGLTLGLGYTIIRSIALDYAMLPAGDQGASHRVSLTYKFIQTPK